MNILSIQSHVAYGYVGNKAATYPLQSMGHDTWAINTVQFSNHTGYKSWTGDIFSACHIRELFNGIMAITSHTKCDAVLTGYIGDQSVAAEIIAIVQKLREENPKLIYLCDPVMGDVDGGFFVSSEVSNNLKMNVAKEASIMTPNQFEMEFLWGHPIYSLQDAKEACRYWHEKGVAQVLITSFRFKNGESGKQYVYLSDQGKSSLAETPSFHFESSLSGTGDLFAALFLGHYLRTKNAREALLIALNQLFTVVEKTFSEKRNELFLIGRDYSQFFSDRRVKIIEL